MQDRRIPNMQLAEEMAYAAAPYYNVARVVMSYSQLQYDELSLAADKAATAAGAEYLLYLFGIVSGDSEIAQPEALYPDLNYADSILVSR